MSHSVPESSVYSLYTVFSGFCLFGCVFLRVGLCLSLITSLSFLKYVTRVIIIIIIMIIESGTLFLNK